MKKYSSNLWQKYRVIFVLLFCMALSVKSQASFSVQLVLSTTSGGSAAIPPLCVNNIIYYFTVTITKESTDDGTGDYQLVFKGSDGSYTYIDNWIVFDAEFAGGTVYTRTASFNMSSIFLSTYSLDNGQLYAQYTNGPNYFSTIYATSAPFVVVSPSSASINSTSSVTLTASSSSSSSYAWTPSTALNQTTGASVIASPGTTKTYKVIATNTITGCVGSKTVTITVTGPCCAPNKVYNNQTLIDTYTSDYITASGNSTLTSGSIVALKAANYILFNPDVVLNSASNTTFTASIGSCIYNGCRTGSFEVLSSQDLTGTSADILADQSSETISVYPNPSNGIFTIKSFGNIDGVVVLNSLGSVILSDSKAQVDLSNHPEGFYYFRVSSSGKTVTKMVFKR